MNCKYCEEEIAAGDQFQTVNGGAEAMHNECLLRLAVGSADCSTRGPHVPGTCLGDDPALTKREAARAAVLAWCVKHTRPAARTVAPRPVEEMTEDELRAELALREINRATPGYFAAAFGAYAEVMEQADYYRTGALRSALEERAWPSVIGGRQ